MEPNGVYISFKKQHGGIEAIIDITIKFNLNKLEIIKLKAIFNKNLIYSDKINYQWRVWNEAIQATQHSTLILKHIQISMLNRIYYA